MQEGNKKTGEELGAKRLLEAPVAREQLPLCSYTADSSYSDISRIIFFRFHEWQQDNQFSKLRRHGNTKSDLAFPAGAKELRVPRQNKK
jgi:hypothetical protein